MADRSTVLASMTLFTKTTKNPPALEKEMIDLWTSLLQDIPDDLLMTSAQQLCVELVFFPSLAEVRNKAIELKMASLNIPTWGEAWDECHKKCIRGTRGEFSHPLVEKAYDCLGNWDTLLTDDVPTARAQFRQIYEQLCNRQEKEVKLLPASKDMQERCRLEISNLAKRLSAG